MANQLRIGGRFYFDGAQIEIGAIPIEAAKSVIVATWTDDDADLAWWTEQELADTLDWFQAPIEAAAAVALDYVVATLEAEEVELEEQTDAWTPQLFDPFVEPDFIAAATLSDDDDLESQEVLDWISAPFEDAVAPSVEFIQSPTDDDASNVDDDATHDFDSPGPIDDAPPIPPVISAAELAQIYGGNILAHELERRRLREIEFLARKQQPSMRAIVRELIAKPEPKAQLLDLVADAFPQATIKPQLAPLVRQITHASKAIQHDIRLLWARHKVEEELEEEEFIVMLFH